MVRTGVLLRLTSYFLTFSVGSALVTSGGPRAATPSLKLPLPTSTSGLTRIGEHKQLRLSVPFIICVHSMHANQMVLFSLFCIVACILSYHLRRISNVVLLRGLYHYSTDSQKHKIILIYIASSGRAWGTCCKCAGERDTLRASRLCFGHLFLLPLLRRSPGGECVCVCERERKRELHTHTQCLLVASHLGCV